MRAGVISTRGIYLIAGFISLVISFWMCSQQSVINTDAICYLLSANEVGKAGVSAAMHLCGQASWPFYSALVYAFSKFSFLSLTTSAYVLNGILTLISVLAFMAIVEKLGGSRRVMWLAAFVILSAHQFNAVRQYIVRDHGFWAFYLLSILFLLSFLKEHSWKNALGFSGSLAVAALFRIEGAVFLAILPLLAFVIHGSWRVRVLQFLKLNSLSIAAVIALAVWVIAHPEKSLAKLGRAPELWNQTLHGFSLVAEHFRAAKTALIQHVLPEEAARDAGMVWSAVLIGLYFANIIDILSFAATALVIYAWWSGVTAQFSRSAKWVLGSYVAINLVVLAFFFAERLFFSKRYLIALVLVLLLWVPFALDKLLRAPDVKRRYVGYFAMLVLFASSLGVLTISGASKTFVRDAGGWAAANIPATARFYTNDIQVAYYSQHYGNDIFVLMRENHDINAALQSQLQQYEYAALRTGKNRDSRLVDMMNEAHAPIVQTFANQSGDQVIIYKIPQQAG